MAHPAKSSAAGKQQVEPGKIHAAYIDQVIVLGVQSGKYGDKEQVWIRIAFPESRYLDAEGNDGGPLVIGQRQTYTYWFDEAKKKSSNLAALIKGVTGQWPEWDFDVFSLLGKGCNVYVQDVDGWSRVGPITSAPDPTNTETKLYKFDPDSPGESNITMDQLPDWLQELISNRVGMGEKGFQKKAAAANTFSDDDLDNVPF